MCLSNIQPFILIGQFTKPLGRSFISKKLPFLHLNTKSSFISLINIASMPKTPLLKKNSSRGIHEETWKMKIHRSQTKTMLEKKNLHFIHTQPVDIFLFFVLLINQLMHPCRTQPNGSAIYSTKTRPSFH